MPVFENILPTLYSNLPNVTNDITLEIANKIL